MESSPCPCTPLNTSRSPSFSPSWRAAACGGGDRKAGGDDAPHRRLGRGRRARRPVRARHQDGGRLSGPRGRALGPRPEGLVRRQHQRLPERQGQQRLHQPAQARRVGGLAEVHRRREQGSHAQRAQGHGDRGRHALGLPTSTRCAAFNRKTGALVANIKVPGAVFINDIAVGPDGLYATDSGIILGPDGSAKHPGPDAVYKIAGRKATTAVKFDGQPAPNGITWDPNGERFSSRPSATRRSALGARRQRGEEDRRGARHVRRHRSVRPGPVPGDELDRLEPHVLSEGQDAASSSAASPARPTSATTARAASSSSRSSPRTSWSSCRCRRRNTMRNA